MQLFDLTAKTALITGASSGLGEQFTRCMLNAGPRRILAVRRLDKLKTLGAQFDNAQALQMDVANKDSVQKCFTQLEKMQERIDICINNAGLFNATAVFEEDPQSNFESVMQTNVMGVCYVTKAAANHMKRLGAPRSIITISSANGAHCLQANRTGCCASKAAAAAIMLGPFHTAVTDYKVFAPGLRRNLEACAPLRFFAQPSSLDRMILYFRSDNTSKHVAGASFTIDGGIS